MLTADSAAITGGLSQQDRDDWAVAVSVAMGRNITNKTYLQGITEFTALLQQPHKAETWLARRAVATLNPASALGRSVDKAIDPTIKDKKVRLGNEESWVILRKFHNELASTVPGWGGGLRPKRNFITGSLIEYPVGYGPDNLSILNPIKETNSVNHIVLSALADVGARIEQPSDNLPFGKTLGGKQELSGIKLDKDQYADYIDEIAFVKIGGVPLVQALYKSMQLKETKALMAVARGENLNSNNLDVSVAAQEQARANVEVIFKDIISIYKKAGKMKYLGKNPDLYLQYQQRKNEIRKVLNDSVQTTFDQIQGASN
jgi:hypothetical protein